MIKYIYIYIYLEREKIKALGLVGPMGKRGCLSTFILHLGLVGNWVLNSIVAPLVYFCSFIFYLVLASFLCVPLV